MLEIPGFKTCFYNSSFVCKRGFASSFKHGRPQRHKNKFKNTTVISKAKLKKTQDRLDTMNQEKIPFKKNDALIIVDVQKDFCPGGALAIPEGDIIIPYLNNCIQQAETEQIPVYYSRDFHPVVHPSFESQGGPWPAHCVQDTDGTKFHPDLYIADNAVFVTKGVRFDQDQNSVFDQTGLKYHLESAGVQRVWIGGLAMDVCVVDTVLDALASNLQAILLGEGTKPVTEQGGQSALEKMSNSGAVIYPTDSK